MGALASFLGAGFTSLVAWLAALVGQRAATLVAAVTAIGALTVTLFGVLNTITSSISSAIPTSALFIFAMLPTNFNQCLSAIIAARVARWIYDTNVKVVELASKAG